MDNLGMENEIVDNMNTLLLKQIVLNLAAMLSCELEKTHSRETKELIAQAIDLSVQVCESGRG